MIRLTKSGTGEPIYISPEHLIEVGYDSIEKQTLVSTSAEGWYVQESPEEIVRKVLEWKLAMEGYRASVFAEAKKLAWSRDVEYRIMLNLAGLEEPNHDTR